MQGGLVGSEPSGSASVTTTAAPSGPSAGEPATDGGQPRADPEPRNIVAGAIAGTDWTHDDVTTAIVLWLLLEVSSR